jgi:hypothetical protein
VGTLAVIMTDQPKLLIFEEHTFTVGQETFIDSTADNNNAVIFEDNEETGYFYAVDRNNDLNILDGLHIYDVENVVDKHLLSTVKILWTTDNTKAFLSINNYYHAVFDFKNKAGYCRNGFPENTSGWTRIQERKLTDLLIDKLAEA